MRLVEWFAVIISSVLISCLILFLIFGSVTITIEGVLLATIVCKAIDKLFGVEIESDKRTVIALIIVFTLAMTVSTILRLVV